MGWLDEKNKNPCGNISVGKTMTASGHLNIIPFVLWAQEFIRVNEKEIGETENKSKMIDLTPTIYVCTLTLHCTLNSKGLKPQLKGRIFQGV